MKTDLPIEADASIRRGVDRPRCQPSCPMQPAPAAAVNVMHTSVGNIFSSLEHVQYGGQLNSDYFFVRVRPAVWGN